MATEEQFQGFLNQVLASNLHLKAIIRISWMAHWTRQLARDCKEALQHASQNKKSSCGKRKLDALLTHQCTGPPSSICHHLYKRPRLLSRQHCSVHTNLDKGRFVCHCFSLLNGIADASNICVAILCDKRVQQGCLSQTQRRRSKGFKTQGVPPQSFVALAHVLCEGNLGITLHSV
eukprot:1137677-Pelagomonas_calceolata.AAC.6